MGLEKESKKSDYFELRTLGTGSFGTVKEV